MDQTSTTRKWRANGIQQVAKGTHGIIYHKILSFLLPLMTLLAQIMLTLVALLSRRG
jgi:hypothetical protein